MKKTEALYDLILRLKRETNAITMNPLLDNIDLDKIKAFEIQSEANPHFKQKLKNIWNNLKKTDFLFHDRYKAAYDTYNELIVFELLNDKIKTEFVKEGTLKTPDYKLSINESNYVYSDLKTLHFSDGRNNYNDVQEQNATAKIKMEKEMAEKKGNGVYFSEPTVISPLKNPKLEWPYSIKDCIESLIDSLVGLVKLDQIRYENKSGIFLIDVLLIGLPNHLELGLPVHEGPMYRELNSGILWNVVFGKTGDPTYNWIEFEGQPNVGKRLERNGFLVDEQHKEVKAVSFILTSDNPPLKRILSFHRTSEKDEVLLRILYQISDFVNDEKNSRYFLAQRPNNP